MNYGFYLSASGALTSLHRQDVISNNLANVQTTAFKPDAVDSLARLPERVEDGATLADPQWLLEQLGGGTLVDETQTRFQQGPVEPTDNSLDLALRGDGFFAVETGRGDSDNRLRFTRDGRFTLNTNRELVLASNGMRVLDSDDQPIQLNSDAPVRIDTEGDVIQKGRAIAKIQVTARPEQESITRLGDNLFQFDPQALESRRTGQASVLQGHIESSAVDPIMTLNQLMSATKAVQANTKLMQYHDNIMDQAINTMGRVA